MHRNQYYAHGQRNVNEPGGYVKREKAKEPQNNQNQSEYRQHVVFSSFLVLRSAQSTKNTVEQSQSPTGDPTDFLPLATVGITRLLRSTAPIRSLQPEFPISTLSLRKLIRRPPLSCQSQIAMAVVEWHRGSLGSPPGWPSLVLASSQLRR